MPPIVGRANQWMKFLLDAVPEDAAAEDKAVVVDVTAGRSGIVAIQGRKQTVGW